jgi:hypothetical protein
MSGSQSHHCRGVDIPACGCKLPTKHDRAFDVRTSAACVLETSKGRGVVVMRSPDIVTRKLSGLLGYIDLRP